MLSGVPTNVRLKAETQNRLPSPAVRRALRLAAGVAQIDVARDCRVTVPAVSRWERGLRTPRGEALTRYLAALDEMREFAQ